MSSKKETNSRDREIALNIAEQRVFGRKFREILLKDTESFGKTAAFERYKKYCSGTDSVLFKTSQADLVQKVVSEFNMGASLKQIMDQTGFGEDSVKNILGDLGLKRDIDIEKIKRMLQVYKTEEEIADYYMVSRQYIGKILKESGISPVSDQERMKVLKSGLSRMQKHKNRIGGISGGFYSESYPPDTKAVLIGLHQSSLDGIVRPDDVTDSFPESFCVDGLNPLQYESSVSDNKEKFLWKYEETGRLSNEPYIELGSGKNIERYWIRRDYIVRASRKWGARPNSVFSIRLADGEVIGNSDRPVETAMIMYGRYEQKDIGCKIMEAALSIIDTHN